MVVFFVYKCFNLERNRERKVTMIVHILLLSALSAVPPTVYVGVQHGPIAGLMTYSAVGCLAFLSFVAIVCYFNPDQ